MLKIWLLTYFFLNFEKNPQNLDFPTKNSGENKIVAFFDAKVLSSPEMSFY